MGSLPVPAASSRLQLSTKKTNADYAALVVTGTIPRNLALESAAEYYRRRSVKRPPRWEGQA